MKMLASLMLALLPFALLGSAVSAAAEESGSENTMNGLQVGAGDCLVAKPPARTDTAMERSALDAIAGAVISQGVNYIGKAFTAAGAAKTWTASGARNIQATAAEFPQCVLVVRGSFLTEGGPAKTWTAPSGWPEDLSSRLEKQGLRLSNAPDFIFEGEIVAADDKSALTIRPVIATYMKPIGTRFLRWGSERSVALFFAITAPGTKPTLDTNPAATIVLGKLVPSVTYRYAERKNKMYSSPYESPWFTLTKADSVKPLTVTAMLSETQDEQEFLTFLGTVFSDPKVTAAANTQLTQMLIPSAAQQATQEATTKAATGANDADTKFGLVIAKLNTCKGATEASSVVAAGADARNALRNYMLADAALAAPRGDVQHATIDKIDLRKNSDSIKSECVSILAQLAKP